MTFIDDDDELVRCSNMLPNTGTGALRRRKTAGVELTLPMSGCGVNDIATGKWSKVNKKENILDGKTESASTKETSSWDFLTSPTTFPPISSSKGDRGIQLVDQHIWRVTLGSTVVWVALVACCYSCTPREFIYQLSGLERTAPLFACGILLASLLSHLLPLFWRRKGRKSLSSVIVASIVVQGVAMITDAMMAFLPSPVMVDPVLGTRVHLLRWCEWAPLAFAMTFITEVVDAPQDGQGKSRHSFRLQYMNAACQGLSTLCGLIFPFCPGPLSWTFAMVISCILFAVIFPRVYHKRRVWISTKRGSSMDEIERYDRVHLSYKLLATCTTAWSTLVGFFFFAWLAPSLAAEGSILKTPALTMVCESFMDVVAKNLYLHIMVSVHDLVFDESARTERRLDELRRMMSSVWESSSDAIVISVRNSSGSITTMVSPQYMKICHHSMRRSHHKQDFDILDAKALLFDIKTNESKSQASRDESNQGQFTSSSNSRDTPPKTPLKINHTAPCKIEPKMVRKVEFNGLSSIPSVTNVTRTESIDAMTKIHNRNQTMNSSFTDKYPGTSKEEISSLADLIVHAWDCVGRDTLFVHELVQLDSSRKKHAIRCEANVNRLMDNALVVIVRDISERFHRFEAEKQLIAEVTAREKDEQANRFTRHEVKNGLLAAIGLCDSLRDTCVTECSPSDEMNAYPSRISSSATALDVPGAFWKPDALKCVEELDRNLREILDSVLAEAMARDVTHEIYEPKVERVNINQLLTSARGYNSQNSRFPVISEPSPLPLLLCDPQLLKYIHRNAVSNACKYGKKGGVITTVLRLDETSSMLEMNVINLPGDNHDEILALGEEANEIVFAQGKRLHGSYADAHSDSKMQYHSSGDGAWMMKKCAKTLGGSCSIRFEETRTIFNLCCPATPMEKVEETISSFDPSQFQLPTGTWGIAIDDSKIQRRLMGQFFRFLGVKESRQVILGQDANEIYGFDDIVVQLIDQHPYDYFFLVADENLDMTEGIVSGSVCIENIRKRLLPEQERRLIALVRSANDSAYDVAIYNARSHGFLPKAPIRKETVAEMVAPLWEKRYMYRPPVGIGSFGDCQLEEDDECEVIAELDQTVSVIDELCSTGSSLEDRWSLIWENLHKLKGDLSTFSDSPEVTHAVKEISSLRGPNLPTHFLSRWQRLRSLVKAFSS